MDVVGGDQRHVVGIGPIDQPALGLLFAGQAVTLKLDIETVAECRLHGGQGRLPLGRLALNEQRVNRPVGTAGEQKQAFGMSDHLIPRHAGFIDRACIEKRRGRQSGQVQPARLVLNQQDHGRHLGPALIDLTADARDRQGAARIGWTPAALAPSLNSSAPNRLARSVTPTAGMPASAARVDTLPALIAPSSNE